MSLSNYQFSFNGLTFGSGTPYIVNFIDGLMGLPPLRTQDDNRGYIDGSYSGRDFYDARTVTFDILITGDSTHNAQYYFKQWQTTIYPQTLGYPSALHLFQFQLTTESFSGDSTVTGWKLMYGRARSRASIIDPEYSFGYIKFQVEFYFPDPRYYDYQDKSITLTTPSGVITNNGSATTCPYIYIASPASSFTITDSTIVMSFSNVNTSSSLSIDLLQRTIVNGAGASQRNVMDSGSNGWLSVAAGTSANWLLSSGSMQVTWRNAYV